jgi:hypothetical protein
MRNLLINMVPGAGLEPAQYCYRGILSFTRYPNLLILLSQYRTKTPHSDCHTPQATPQILSVIFTLLLTGCASGPSVKNQSDIAQMADAATTITAIEVFGFIEGNPLIEPLTHSPVGYAGLVALKLGINTGLRNASPEACTTGIRVSTSAGYGAAAWNAALMLGAGPYGAIPAVIVAVINWRKNSGFIRECQLEEKFPGYDIYRAWEEGELYGEGIKRQVDALDELDTAVDAVWGQRE